jgi:hypothetical protein
VGQAQRAITNGNEAIERALMEEKISQVLAEI